MLTGCVSQGLAFQVDDRLTITDPKARADVKLPVTVRWNIKDFTVRKGDGAGGGRSAGYFGVIVDGTPQPPGKPLSWFARKDRSCRSGDGCPDAEYLAARGLYSTTDMSLTFEQLPRPSDSNKKERHNVTVILLDPAGKRIGESAFNVEFTLRRKGLS